MLIELREMFIWRAGKALIIKRLRLHMVRKVRHQDCLTNEISDRGMAKQYTDPTGFHCNYYKSTPLIVTCPHICPIIHSDSPLAAVFLDQECTNRRVNHLWIVCNRFFRF